MGSECTKYLELLSEYIDGEMSTEARARLEQHMEDCPPCDDFLQELRSSVKMTQQIRWQEIPVEMKRRLRRFLAGKIRPA